jgi:LPS O-antigen subunit length determinant protein (WzzB/FepE family)
MDQIDRPKEINMIDLLAILWKKKWLIVMGTLAVAAFVGVISFLLTPAWDVDMIIQPSKILVETGGGQFTEFIVVDPKQIAGQINQAAYDNVIASELNMDVNKFPKIHAENIRDSNLLRAWVRVKKIETGTKILDSLFLRLKSQFDKKIDVEMKGLDTQISEKNNAIKDQELRIRESDLDINDKWTGIKLLDIKKTKARQEISSDENKLKISEERYAGITEEMRAVKKRIDEIEGQQKKALEEKRQESEALGMLLYSNVIQNNLQYFNALQERLNTEKITQEALRLDVKDKNETIKELDTQIEKLKNEIDKIRNDVDKIKNETEKTKKQIEFLNDRKNRIDYAQVIKAPTPTLKPAYPDKKANVLIAGALALMLFAFLAFVLDYLEKQKTKNR